MKTGCKNIYVKDTHSLGKDTRICDNGQLMTKKLRKLLKDGVVVSVPKQLALDLIEGHYAQKKQLRQQAVRIRELEAQAEKLEAEKKEMQAGIDRLVEFA